MAAPFKVTAVERVGVVTVRVLALATSMVVAVPPALSKAVIVAVSLMSRTRAVALWSIEVIVLAPST